MAAPKRKKSKKRSDISRFKNLMKNINLNSKKNKSTLKKKYSLFF